MSARVLLLEGRVIVRLGIKALLQNHHEIEIVAEASNESDAYRIAKEKKPDVIVMDLDSHEKTAILFIQKIKKFYPKIRILVFTLQDYESALIKFLEAGADGYVLKNTAHDELAFAIQKIKKEGSYMKPGLILNVLAKFKESSESEYRAKFNITPREMDVLNLIGDGFTNTQIAGKLFTSVRTIETRRKKLLDKTGTLNTATLMRFSVLNGLLK